MSPRPYVVEFYRARDLWRWRLRAPNGRVMCIGEQHATRSKARRAFAAIGRAVIGGRVWEQDQKQHRGGGECRSSPRT